MKAIKDSRKNGEFWFINKINKINSDENKRTYFDIGAFKGEWTVNLKKSLGKNYINNQIYLFEPSPSSFKFLKKEFSFFDNIHVYNLAFFSSKSKLLFFYKKF